MAPLLMGPIDGVAVLGGGTAFPPRVLTNAQVLQGLPPGAQGPRHPTTPDDLAIVATGVEAALGFSTRAWAHAVGFPLKPASEPSVLELSIAAAREALAEAGLAPSALSLILCATSTPHRMTATVSAALGAALGTRAACMDVRTGCAGALFGLCSAALFLQAGSGPVLLVGAETFSKVIPPGSRAAQLSLGDGAGALVLGRREGCGLSSMWLETDGALGKLVTTDGALPPTQAELDRGGYLLSGSAEALGEVVPGKYVDALAQALSRAGLAPADIDLFVPHQTSAPLIREVCARSGLSPARTFVNVGAHANIGSAGWVVALVEARREGRCPPGARVALAAVGGGMSWAAGVLAC